MTIVAGLLSIRLYTELAPREVLGGASLVMGAMTLLMNLIVAPFTQTQVRYQAEYSRLGQGDSYQVFILQHALVATLMAGVPMTACLLVWPATRLGSSVIVIPMLAVWALSTTLRNVLVGRLNADRRQRQYSRFIALEAVSIALATAVALLVWKSIEAFIAGQIVGLLLAIILSRSCMPVLYRRAVIDGDIRRRLEWQRIYLYGSPFAAIFVLEWLVNQTDRYILAMHLTLDAVGLYAAAFMLASRPAMLAGTILSDLLRPVLFATTNLGSRSIRNFETAWLGIQLVSSACMIAVFLFAGELIAEIFLGEAYRPGAPELMELIAAAYGVRAIALVMENQIYAREQPSRIAIAKLLPTIVVTTSALLLIPVMGLTGAALANLCAQISFVIACLLAHMVRPQQMAHRP